MASCKHEKWIIWTKPEDNWTGVPAGYECCSACGTYRSLLADPSIYASPDYWSAAHGHGNLYEQAYNCDLHTENGVSKSRFILDRIASERGAALEIGCAPGRMLYWLKWAARFNYIVGVDPAQAPTIDHISAHSADAMFTGLFPEVVSGIPNKPVYDYILAADVFEHVNEPAEFLSACARLLKPGGQLFLMLPLADGLPMDSRMFNATEHAYIHSLANLQAMFADAGFERVQMDRWASGHDTVSAFKV